MRIVIACLLLALFSPSAVIAEIIYLPVEKEALILRRARCSLNRLQYLINYSMVSINWLGSE